MQKATIMWDMTKKIKDMHFLQNIANNKTHRAQCLPPAGHARS